MRDFRRLDVWNRAHRLTLDIFEATSAFPRAERFGLQAQIRRSAMSIPSNIAEGAGRETRRDYGRFLSVAIGSAHELDYQLQLSKDLGFISGGRHMALAREVIEVRSMLATLRRRVLAESG